ncbi:hypothetical protein NY035_07030 [Corynebacterium diphtheriae bv. mitis]|uniref:Uncharacterized protein n=1 Tax=Corynebacterium diphtheriae TaxID=1717 RepID=A0A1X4KT52_CORDP|nr:hypothetical protein [Corynebacterium diphtheriae]OWN10490.1 hypothetical protein AY479_09405 [Corynebacterium belfantii]AEX42781.1 hypothetical protein CD31A_2114 [Corynebacterium diphtheriae 31A]AEX47250.1 hypothetical protein CDB402_1954 [Corynebacterium diphtheriae INCA 402]APM36173.1 hypothetical protein BS112_06505 [Corynebacterium diphtheriae]MBG9222669.1 hypothetical protein [Corynebacterium diphtheriae bv. mitis]
MCTRPSPSALKSAVASIVLAFLIGYIEVVRQLRAGRARKNIVAKVPEQPHQGLDTKDNVVVDWHDPAHVEIKNPTQ